MSGSRLILALFIVAQIFDGIFTYVAVASMGTSVEANSLLATWMHLIGPAPTLLGAKVAASACGLVLYARGIHRGLLVLTLFYAVAAIGPWLIFYRG